MDTIIGYQLDSEVFQRLRYIEKQLYGDGSRLTEDRRRDLANYLNWIISLAQPIHQKED